MIKIKRRAGIKILKAFLLIKRITIVNKIKYGISKIAENLDNQVIGIFEIKFIFFDSLNQELSSDILSYPISPGNNQTFTSSFYIQGQEGL